MNVDLRVRNARHWRTGEVIAVDVRAGMIVKPSAGPAAHEVDARGAWIAPGLVDIHVHLREPGQTVKETIATGCAAAAAGGFTAVACMPNTRPVVDTPAWVEWVRGRAREAASCRVYPIAAVTQGQKGQELCEMRALAEAGAIAFSDDGLPIVAAGMMRRALEYAHSTGLPIICHEEDPTLSNHGSMREGATCTRLGLRGMPSAAESVMVRRDVELAALTRGRVHLAHLSCRESFDALRDAKRRGLAITGETCPHYWVLTDEAVGEYDTHAKMHPPLPSVSDRDAVIEAIADGTVDCFATDHAPHTAGEKRQPFEQAPNGIVGLETALGLTLTHLVQPGHITLERALELWTDAPRRVLGLPEVSVAPGFPADLVLIDDGLDWTVDSAQFRSRGRATPFEGWTLRGRAVATVCGGKITHAVASLADASTTPSQGAST